MIQFTLVDCPGHSAFIKSVIAGASTIDLMILVIDITKGLQVQTAECIALGEILKLDLLVVLNKIDLVSEKNRWKRVQATRKALQKMFKASQFRNKKRVHIVGYSPKMLGKVDESVSIRNLALISKDQTPKSEFDEKKNLKENLIEKITEASLQSFRFSHSKSRKNIKLT